MATYEQGQSQVISLTEKEMRPHWNDSLTAYDEANKSVDASIFKLYGKMPTFTDDQKSSGSMYTWALSSPTRLKKTKSDIKTEYTKYSILAGISIALSSKVAITNAYYREQYISTFFSEQPIKFTNINPNIVKASVTGEPQYWTEIRKKVVENIYGSPNNYFPQTGSLSDLLVRNRSDELTKINNAINAALIQGKGADELTDDILKIIGDEISKNGVKSYSGARASAAKIARTEGIRNLNSGVLADSFETLNQGIDISNEWNATFDMRVRQTHATADGQRRKPGELFNVGGATGTAPAQLNQVGENINCRCSLSPVLPDIEADQRSGRNPVTGKSEIFSFTKMDDYMDTFKLKFNKNGVMVKV